MAERVHADASILAMREPVRRVEYRPAAPKSQTSEMVMCASTAAGASRLTVDRSQF
jgi:hypothetical protein